ncbi:MAG TPA: FtsX-like permease family protein, partial [Thermomicrobiales bacterium]|nr:FtsX-like permease family protein [Thermomicrobiales bacterium]
NDDATAISGLDHVTALVGILSAFQIDSTLTAPAIELPAGVTPPAGFDSSQSTTTTDTSGVRIQTEGTSDPSSIVSASTTGTGAMTLTSGVLFTADQLDADVAVISESLATTNNLAVGSTITIGGTALKVVGIVTTSDSGRGIAIYLPLTTAQKVLDEADTLSEIRLDVDDISNVDAVAAAVTAKLGTDFSVTTSEDQYNQIASTLKDAQNSSRVALVVAGLASCLVIIFGVILSARQRIKEIGIMKAVGAANRQVVLQFGIETLVVGLIAGILGSLVTFPVAQSVANGLTSSGTSSSGGGGFSPGGGGGNGGAGAAFFQAGRGVGQGVQRAGGVLGSINVAVSPVIFLYALAFAVVLALVASIGPAMQVSRVRPAEVLRHD